VSRWGDSTNWLAPQSGIVALFVTQKNFFHHLLIISPIWEVVRTLRSTVILVSMMAFQAALMFKKQRMFIVCKTRKFHPMRMRRHSFWRMNRCSEHKGAWHFGACWRSKIPLHVVSTFLCQLMEFWDPATQASFWCFLSSVVYSQLYRFLDLAVLAMDA
jgi:hypothetical protein